MDHPTRPEFKLYGICLIVAPLLLAAATLFWDGASAGLAGGVLMMYSFTFWIGVFLAFAARLQPRMPRFALAAATSGILACVAGTNFGVEGVVEAGMGIADLSEAMVAGGDPPNILAMVLTFFLPGALFPLTLLAFAVALVRAQEIPAWSGALLAFSAAAFPLSRIPRIQSLAVAADLILLVPMLWLGWQYLRAGAERRYAAAHSALLPE